MPTDYESRLRVSIAGSNDILLTSKMNAPIAKAYTRIVIGKRGPYVEFLSQHLVWEHIDPVAIPHLYYDEWRTKPDHIKIYEQKLTVDYADYIVGLFYISPFELAHNGVALIEPLKKKLESLKLFD